MKSFILVTLIWALSAYNGFSSIGTKIKSVTVFRHGAQINRTAKIDVAIGNNQFIFSGIPDVIDYRTITISLPKQIRVLSVHFQDKPESVKDDEFLKLQNLLSLMNETKEENNILILNYVDEESLILSNKILTNDKSLLSAEALAKMADFYRVRLLDIRKNIHHLKHKNDSLEIEIKNINEKMEEVKPFQYSKYLVVNIQSDIKGIFDVEVDYLHPNANWTSNYALRLLEINQPIALDHIAEINQNTGENWENIDLILATGDPKRSFSIPHLNTWFLKYRQEEILSRQHLERNNVFFIDGVQIQSNSRVDDEELFRENFTFSQYIIPFKVNVNHGIQNIGISIKSDTLNSVLNYYCVPSYSNKVFLKAGLIDWTKHSLSSGDVKVYFESTYTGITYLNTFTSDDTLQVSLGQDIAVNCTSKKVKSFKKSLAFSNKKEQTEIMEFTIKNNKSYPIELEVQERMPVSTDKDMKIVLLESAGGTLDEASGFITWKLKLNSGEKVVNQWTYAITYPESKSIQL